MPWEPLPDSIGEPTRVAGPLDALLTRLVGTTAATADVVFDRWSEIVGAGMAQFARPVRIEDAVLVVVASDPAFAGELRWMEQAIIDRVQALGGTSAITAVRVVVER